MHYLADIEFGKILAPVFTGLAVTMVTRYLYKAASSAATDEADSHCVRYPETYKTFVKFFWLVTVITFVGAVVTARGNQVLPAVLCVIFFFVITLAFHAETYLLKITWDDEHIFTRSPWRPSRTIPLASVERCDFSKSMAEYRIHTKGHGIVRLSMFARGIPGLLEILPVSHPGYPPPLPNRDRRDGGAASTSVRDETERSEK